jgi:hypothetical protein
MVHRANAILAIAQVRSKLKIIASWQNLIQASTTVGVVGEQEDE